MDLHYTLSAGGSPNRPSLQFGPAPLYTQDSWAPAPSAAWLGTSNIGAREWHTFSYVYANPNNYAVVFSGLIACVYTLGGFTINGVSNAFPTASSTNLAPFNFTAAPGGNVLQFSVKSSDLGSTGIVLSFTSAIAPCAINFFSNTTSTFPLSAECAPCPVGAVCPGNGALWQLSITSPGPFAPGSMVPCTFSASGLQALTVSVCDAVSCTDLGMTLQTASGSFSAPLTPAFFGHLTLKICDSNQPYQCLPAAAFEVACGAGTYLSSGGGGGCLPCASGGTYSTTVGAVSAAACINVQCPAGAWCPLGAGQPTLCTAGSFSTLLGAVSASTCAVCAIGTFNPLAGANSSSACRSCPAGTWCTAGARSPTLCARGTFRATTGGTSASACSPCQSGTTSGAGASSCTPFVACSAPLGTAISFLSPGAPLSDIAPLVNAPLCSNAAANFTLNGFSGTFSLNFPSPFRVLGIQFMLSPLVYTNVSIQVTGLDSVGVGRLICSAHLSGAQPTTVSMPCEPGHYTGLTVSLSSGGATWASLRRIALQTDTCPITTGFYCSSLGVATQCPSGSAATPSGSCMPCTPGAPADGACFFAFSSCDSAGGCVGEAKLGLALSPPVVAVTQLGPAFAAGSRYTLTVAPPLGARVTVSFSRFSLGPGDLFAATLSDGSVIMLSGAGPLPSLFYGPMSASISLTLSTIASRIGGVALSLSSSVSPCGHTLPFQLDDTSALCVASCPAGFHVGPFDVCTACKAGTFRGANDIACSDCLPNMYSVAGAASCIPCPGWSFRDSGMSECLPCDEVRCPPQLVDTWVNLVAGSDTGGSGSSDGLGADALFSSPWGVLVEPDVFEQKVFVADLSNYQVRLVSTESLLTASRIGSVSTFSGSGAQMMVDGSDLTSAFYNPTSITACNMGDLSTLVVIDQGGAVRLVSKEDGSVTTLAGNPANAGICGYADGNGTSAEFCNPSDATVLNGAIYVTDTYSCVIRAVFFNSSVETYAGQAWRCSYPYVDTTDGEATFYYPYSIVALPDGSLVVGDGAGYYGALRQITARNSVRTLAGGLSTGSSDGIGTAATFHNIVSLATSQNILYIADLNWRSSNHIRTLNFRNLYVSTIAGRGSTFTERLNSEARFIYGSGMQTSFSPGGINLGPDGVLVIADPYNNNVIALGAAAFTVSVLAGSGGTYFYEGLGTTAAFSAPNAILSLNDGRVLLCDGTRIRAIALNGSVHTVAGNNNTLGVTGALARMQTGLAPPRVFPAPWA